MFEMECVKKDQTDEKVYYYEQYYDNTCLVKKDSVIQLHEEIELNQKQE